MVRGLFSRVPFGQTVRLFHFLSLPSPSMRVLQPGCSGGKGSQRHSLKWRLRSGPSRHDSGYVPLTTSRTPASLLFFYMVMPHLIQLQVVISWFRGSAPVIWCSNRRPQTMLCILVSDRLKMLGYQPFHMNQGLCLKHIKEYHNRLKKFNSDRGLLRTAVSQ